MAIQTEASIRCQGKEVSKTSKKHLEASARYAKTPGGKAVRAALHRKYNAAIKEAIILHYWGGNPHCQCPSGKCEITNIKFLTLDHPEGNGAKDRREHGKGVKFYKWIIRNNFPAGFRILCWNCNSGREKNQGICPHEEY